MPRLARLSLPEGNQRGQARINLSLADNQRKETSE